MNKNNIKKMLLNQGKWKTVIGVPPLTLEKSKGKNFKDYKVYGSSIQDGTPTPDEPIEIQSVGDKTKNLFDKDNYNLLLGYININGGFNESSTNYSIWIPITPNTSYTISRPIGGATIMCGFYENQPTASSTTINGERQTSSAQDLTYTFTSPDTANFMLLRIFTTSMSLTFNEFIKGIQIEEGTTATNYELYGKYKIPVTVSGKNLFDKENAEYKVSSATTETLTNDTFIGTGNEGTSNYVWGAGQLSISFSKSLPANKQYMVSFYVTLLETGVLTNGLQIWVGSKASYAIKVRNFEGLTVGERFKVKYSFILPSDNFESIAIRLNNCKWKIELDTIQIEEGDTATDYEPYVEPVTTNIYLDEPLRKVGDYADYIDFKNQKVVRQISEEILTGNEKVLLSNEDAKPKTTRFSIGFGNSLLSTKGLCTHFKNLDRYDKADEEGFGFGGNFNFRLLNSTATNVEDAKNWLLTQNNDGNPVKVVYVLNTPTEESIELPNIQTNEGTNIITIDTLIQPSNMEVTYKRR